MPIKSFINIHKKRTVNVQGSGVKRTINLNSKPLMPQSSQSSSQQLDLPKIGGLRIGANRKNIQLSF